MKYKVGISWQVADTFEVEADNIDEALAWAREHIDEIPCTDDPEYIDGSFEIDGFIEWEENGEIKSEFVN